jgi:hypothetical protein
MDGERQKKKSVCLCIRFKATPGASLKTKWQPAVTTKVTIAFDYWNEYLKRWEKRWG